MIKSITLENFQSHQHTTLDLPEGVSVITGDSDSGKSGIIKLIRWIKDNRPTGEEYKNWDAKKDDQMAGEIVTDENIVAILRNNGKTKYSLNNETFFEAINKDVPSEITEALNLADYNIQTQFQKYFLLQDSPGEVAKKINELVGLDVIDTLYTNIASEIRETNKEIIINKNTIQETKESLEQYENLDKIEKVIKSIEENYEKSLETNASFNLLSKLVSSYDSIEKDWENVNFVVKLEKTVDSLLKFQDKLTSLEEKLNKIKSLTTSLSTIQEDITSDNDWIELEKPCNDILDRLQKVTNLKNGETNLTTIVTSINNIITNQNREILRQKQYTQEYITLLEKENICPIANLTFPKQCLTNIKNNL